MFTESLGKFLAGRLSDTRENPVISFALPGAVAKRNAINIYLCSLTEDSELRSNEKQYERQGDAWVSTQPPLRLKCTYIVSAWPADENTEVSALLQQSLLSAAFSVLASHSTLPGAFLPAPMAEPNVPKPVIALADYPLPNSPEFWMSVGCTYHPAFSFTATISLPVPAESYDHVVEEVQIDYKLSGL